MKEEGFYLVNTNNKGDHIITVRVEIPKSLTAEQRSLYEKLRAIGK
jgi:DnaJ-class molecular chaperone